MDAPISALPRLLLETRRCWNRTERLAAVIAGLDASDDGGDLADG
jgi:hypothetical protein